MTESTSPPALVQIIRNQRNRQRRSLYRCCIVFITLLIVGVITTLLVGQSMTAPTEAFRAILGEEIAGVSFTVRELRFPRAVLACLAGASFGLSGAAFQVLLRNPLASPDIIGISAGAGAAAVFTIVFWGATGLSVSIAAVVAALVVALLIYLLAWRDGVAGGRLILIGIGIAAMLQSVTAYSLSKAPAWRLEEALRWLTGTLNGATLAQAAPVALTLVFCAAILLSHSRALSALQMGDDTASAIGVPVARTRLLVVLSAVGAIAVATAVCGPIAFVAFLARPIASRVARTGGPLLLISALSGAVLVLLADFAGQHLLPARYPVGIMTGVLGAPYLLYLLVRMHRKGGIA
ncbi:iron chelate uptake ABC transporter family permease subunit [Tritonibacter mobilis]|uniref:FecCD family ABC transporter permease n=1 Tax=Tritonibacter mobilis TaxID=379347 RepID=UPI003BAA6606